jgi:glycosyltransferase involved in cell wall biosynthesis
MSGTGAGQPGVNAVPALTVITPCLNEHDAIEAFLQSVLSQQDVTGGYEVIIADGGSSDGTRAILEACATRDSRVRIIDNPAGTVSPGLNAAVRAAMADVIVRMDVHSEYAPDYLRQCLATLAATGAASVGGPARTRAKTRFQRANALAYHSPFSVGSARFHDVNYEGPVDTVTYGCWRRQTLLTIGLFDEQLVRNQDDELSLRLTRTGGLIWQTPAIRSWYTPRSTARSLFKQYFQYGYWKVYVIRKHRLPASWRHLAPIFALVAMAICVAGGMIDQRFWVAAGLLGGCYLLTSLAASFIAVSRAGEWRLLPLMPIVFATYHFAYGLGFARALFDVLVPGRAPARSSTSLSR